MDDALLLLKYMYIPKKQFYHNSNLEAVCHEEANEKTLRCTHARVNPAKTQHNTSKEFHCTINNLQENIGFHFLYTNG